MDHEQQDFHQRVSIGVCDSGCVLLQFGMSSMHLEPDVFENFVTLLNEALPRIESRRSQMPSKPSLRLVTRTGPKADVVE